MRKFLLSLVISGFIFSTVASSAAVVEINPQDCLDTLVCACQWGPFVKFRKCPEIPDKAEALIAAPEEMDGMVFFECKFRGIPRVFLTLESMEVCNARLAPEF